MATGMRSVLLRDRQLLQVPQEVPAAAAPT
jgi:hypothetical protein